MSKQIQVNGIGKTVDATTIADILHEEGVDDSAPFLAVALNGAVVPRPHLGQLPEAAVLRPGRDGVLAG